eukprot:4831202-Karenia_brevis.AAC.1
MSAYVPLASKLFGSNVIDAALKFNLCASLIESRLLFNLHVRCLRTRELSKINAVYMRVVHRIGGTMRFDKDAISDLEARRLLNAPSVDCLLLRQRLKYCARLAVSDWHALKA